MAPRLRQILMWALTYRCNMSCQYCFLHSPEARHSLSFPEAPTQLIEQILNSINTSHRWKPEAVWLTGGEPTLHPRLLDIIRTLERSGIMTIVTTNGIMSATTALQLCRAQPRGITVSLDSPDEELDYRGPQSTTAVLKTLHNMAVHKNDYTILGVAVTVYKSNLEHLYEIAELVSSIGVEYMSINPLYAWSRASEEIAPPLNTETGELFGRAVEEITGRSIVRQPCELYLNMLRSHLSGLPIDRYPCPAATAYAFIAPWGKVYPCSVEFWHQDPRMKDPPIPTGEDWADIMERLKQCIRNQIFDTYSECFSTRCISCFKLYYDDVFLSRV